MSESFTGTPPDIATVELVRSLSKKLSESDVLETQKYSDVLKRQLQSVKTRMSRLEEFATELAKAIAEAERGASLGGAEGGPEIKTEFSSQLEEMRTEVLDLYRMVLEETHVQMEILERTTAIRRRTDNRMAVLFNQIISETEAVEAKLKSAEARTQTYAKPDEQDIEKRRVLKRKLDKIKRDRCICFGCVDVHPEELYEITGARPQ